METNIKRMSKALGRQNKAMQYRWLRGVRVYDKEKCTCPWALTFHGCNTCLFYNHIGSAAL